MVSWCNVTPFSLWLNKIDWLVFSGFHRCRAKIVSFTMLRITEQSPNTDSAHGEVRGGFLHDDYTRWHFCCTCDFLLFACFVLFSGSNRLFITKHPSVIKIPPLNKSAILNWDSNNFKPQRRTIDLLVILEQVKCVRCNSIRFLPATVVFVPLHSFLAPLNSAHLSALQSAEK